MLSNRFEIENIEIERLPDAIWMRLARGAADRTHPFRTPTIATASQDGPRVRTVVLRKVEAERQILLFHSDVRSHKVHEISHQPLIEWLFYDPDANLQIAVNSVATIHTSDAWAQIPMHSRRCYLSQYAPGTVLKRLDSGIPTEFSHRQPNEAESALGRANFCAVACRATAVRVLCLRTTGNLGARVSYDDRGDVNVTWTAP